ncbi:MAG: DNA-binding protein [Siculibacillus sp.]|nr:DNA-binding protein [Siculibacillus sp.]
MNRSTAATRPTRIRQPGPAPADRVVAVACRGRRFEAHLVAGETLLAGIARCFATEGLSSGTVRLDGLALALFAWCMPAPPRDARHAAFYSETFRAAEVTRVLEGAMTVGRRDGALAFHAHGTWREADGAVRGGHVLPEGTVVAEDVVLPAFGLDGAVFRADPDEETGFTVFAPVAEDPTSLGDGRERAHALRLRPNQDFAGALEDFCRERGITRARIEGGVGSTIGAAFENGEEILPFATEVHLAHGRVAGGPEVGWCAELDGGLVDMSGRVARGRFARGINPVLMTFELVLVVEATDRSAAVDAAAAAD